MECFDLKQCLDCERKLKEETGIKIEPFIDLISETSNVTIPETAFDNPVTSSKGVVLKNVA